jgi:TRAP-type C4-dicarboxylate transport system permease small subunit
MDKTTRGRLEDRIAVAAMAVLVLITLGNVLTRYLTDESFAWTEEISVFLMLVVTLAGAASAFAADSHIRIEFFYSAGSAARRRRLALLGAWLSTALFAVLAVLFAVMVWDEVRYAETSMGLGVPRWWYDVWVPVLCTAIAWRAGVAGVRIARAGPDARLDETPDGPGTSP